MHFLYFPFCFWVQLLCYQAFEFVTCAIGILSIIVCVFIFTQLQFLASLCRFYVLILRPYASTSLVIALIRFRRPSWLLGTIKLLAAYFIIDTSLVNFYTFLDIQRISKQHFREHVEKRWRVYNHVLHFFCW